MSLNERWCRPSQESLCERLERQLIRKWRKRTFCPIRVEQAKHKLVRRMR